jgi:hypothetical protein
MRKNLKTSQKDISFKMCENPCDSHLEAKGGLDEI